MSCATFYTLAFLAAVIITAMTGFGLGLMATMEGGGWMALWIFGPAMLLWLRRIWKRSP